MELGPLFISLIISLFKLLLLLWLSFSISWSVVSPFFIGLFILFGFIPITFPCSWSVVSPKFIWLFILFVFIPIILLLLKSLIGWSLFWLLFIGLLKGDIGLLNGVIWSLKGEILSLISPPKLLSLFMLLFWFGILFISELFPIFIWAEGLFWLKFWFWLVSPPELFPWFPLISFLKSGLILFLNFSRSLSLGAIVFTLVLS